MTTDNMVHRVADAIMAADWLDSRHPPADANIGNYYTMARAAIEAMPKHDWQPIETAPKDGTPILAASGQGTPFVAAWGGIRPPCWKERSKMGPSVWSRPTHWMPLPEPPK